MKNDTKIRCSRSLLLIGFQREEKNEEWYKKSGVTDPGLVSHWSDIVDHLTLIAPSNWKAPWLCTTPSIYCIMPHPLYCKLFKKDFQKNVADPGLVSQWSDIVDHLTLIAPSNQPPLPSRPQLRFPITNTNTNNKIQNTNTNTTNAIKLKNSARCKGPPLPATQPNYSFSSRRKHIYLCARELANFTSSTWRSSFETL